MAIRGKVIATAVNIGCLVFLLLAPIRSECKAPAPTPTPQHPCQSQLAAWDNAYKTFSTASHDLTKMEENWNQLDQSMLKTKSLTNNLDFFKSYLVNYLNSLKWLGDLTKEQQDDYNSVAQGLSNMTALQSRVAARVAVLQKSLDELNPRLAAARRAFNAD